MNVHDDENARLRKRISALHDELAHALRGNAALRRENAHLRRRGDLSFSFGEMRGRLDVFDRMLARAEA